MKECPRCKGKMLEKSIMVNGEMTPIEECESCNYFEFVVE